jgi:CTP:molybdopterin cytidylyltransferase MocA
MPFKLLNFSKIRIFPLVGSGKTCYYQKIMKKRDNVIENFPLILLAAGRSSRMGTPKGLLDFQGRPWLSEQLQRFKAAEGRRVIIVLGFHYKQYIEGIPWLEKAACRPARRFGLKISMVRNPTPEQGPFSSLQCAISFLKNSPRGFPLLRTPTSSGSLLIRSAKPISLNSGFLWKPLYKIGETDRSELRTSSSELFPGAFLLPIDVPCPGKEVFQKLTEAFEPSVEVVIPRYHSRGGHPVLLAPDFLLRLYRIPIISPQVRLDFQIRDLPSESKVIVSVEDSKVTLNINTKDQFQTFFNRYR